MSVLDESEFVETSICVSGVYCQ